MSDLAGFVEFAKRTALAAGDVIREGAQRSIEVHSKGLRDLLTDVDLVAERIIVQAIAEQHPDHDVLTEETLPGRRSSRYCWVIDPLDGTGNFSRRLPFFSTSIALTIDDQPVVGAVYDPMRDQLFTASLGGGATLNGQPLEVTDNTDLIQCVIGLDWTRAPVTRAATVRGIANLTPVVGSLRICGSAALGICYVGAGILDAYWHMELSAWDVAAGAVVVREAGGLVTDLDGEPWTVGPGPCVVSNGLLHGTLCSHLDRSPDSGHP